MTESRYPPHRGDRYLRRLRSVQGWLEPFSAEAVLALSRYQTAHGIRGAVAEIGVHHGKLFFVLFLSTAADEKALAIDVFDQQHLNLDRSGRGDKAIFLSHADRWTGREGLEVLQASSLNLTPGQILERVGRVRLFSIDGSHTTEATLNDLRLAEAALADRGVVVLDDCFNQYWPEVSAGLAIYLGGPSLVPFAITPNKILLCHPTEKPSYLAMLRETFPHRIDKSARVFGHESQIVGLQPWTPRRAIAATRFGQALKRSVVGKTLKRLRG